MKKVFTILMAMLFVASLSFAIVSCKKSEETAAPANATDVKDATKEAATDVKDATKEAATDVKDATKKAATDVKDAAKKATK
jgi:gas vesicle protein